MSTTSHQRNFCSHECETCEVKANLDGEGLVSAAGSFNGDIGICALGRGQCDLILLPVLKGTLHCKVASLDFVFAQFLFGLFFFFLLL